MPQAMSLLRARIRRVLFRKHAVQRLFGDPEGKQALSDDGKIVLSWLKRWSRYGKPPVAKDASGRTDHFETGRLVGRQEAVQLLVEALHLDERVFTNLQEDIPDEH